MAMCEHNDLASMKTQTPFWAPLKTYQDRDEYNFDFELGDSVHRRAGSHSYADQRSSGPKVFRFERLAACCALASLLSPASQQIGNLGTWEVFRGALLPNQTIGGTTVHASKPSLLCFMKDETFTSMIT